MKKHSVIKRTVCIILIIGWMGSLGEMYSTLYRILARGYRVWASPAELYDAMIYVSDAHPIKVIEDQKKIDKLPFGYYNASNRVVTNDGYGGKNR